MDAKQAQRAAEAINRAADRAEAQISAQAQKDKASSKQRQQQQEVAKAEQKQQQKVSLWAVCMYRCFSCQTSWNQQAVWFRRFGLAGSNLALGFLSSLQGGLNQCGYAESSQVGQSS